MRDLLQLLFEYRRLSAKAEAFAGSLRPGGSKRLAALEKLFGKEPDGESKTGRRHARCSVSVPATVKIDGHVQPVKLVNIGGGGVCVSPAPNLKSGDTALLRIVGEDETEVFQYQVRAGWSWRSNTESQMGMPFVGPPRVLSGSSQRADSVY
jgi:hypothetical protein